MPSRLRSLSSEGKLMFGLALDNNSTTAQKKNLKSKIKTCLNFIFIV